MSSKLYSVSQLYGRKIKPTNERFGLWLLQENLHNNNLVTNVGNINYTEGEQLLVSNNSTLLVPITEPFCDNVMLIKICSLDNCDGDGKSLIVKKDTCGSFNSYLRGKFDKFVSARHGVKAKLPFLLKNKNRMARGVETVIGEECLENIYKKYNSPVCVPYKVELADVKLEDLLVELQGLLNQLKKEDYYLMDLDVTQDFVGIFNKTEMVNYLTDNFNFCIQGEYKSNCNVIVDNDNTVGKDCLTWLTSNARVKIYNKFVCQLTSPGVNKKIGNHIINFLNCPDARLKETFSSTSAKEHGITRLEATIYNYSIANYNEASCLYKPLEDCLSLLESSKTYFRQAPFYSVSFAKMWTKLSDALQNSCCVVFNNLLQYVYWGNKITRKLTGIQLNLPKDAKKREKMINYIISAFSFNCLPLNYIEVVEDSGNTDNVKIQQKCYIKTGETFFANTGTPFSTIPENIDIQKAGLVATDNIIAQVLRKRAKLTNRLLPYTVKEIEPISAMHVLSAKKRKLELEEIDLKRRKIEYLEKTTALKEEYRHLLAKEAKFGEFKDRLISHFSKHWSNLDTTGIYKVSAFTVNNKGGYTYVGVLAEKDQWQHVYTVKGYHKNIFIDAYSNIEKLKEDGYIIIPNNGLDIISLPTEKPFLTFTTNGVVTYQGHSFAKIEKMQFLTDVWKNVQDAAFTQEEIQQFTDISMQEIKGQVKIRHCKRLEEFPEGSELTVTGIKAIINRNKTRYILQFQDIENLYVSNFWLEKEIEDSNKDLNFKLKIKLDKLKYTPSRHKERIVFCV